MSYSKEKIQNIQSDYDSGMSWREVMNKYKMGWETIHKFRRLGLLKSRDKSSAMRIEAKKNPKTHSEETKQKISSIRKEYIKNNPDKVPYLMNHYSKGKSFPEEYFTEVFEKENIDLQFHLQVGVYQLDFYNEALKFYVEIDGEQHYSDPRIVESDKRRTDYLSKEGWVGCRIRWSEYQRKTNKEKRKVIESIKEEIKQRSEAKVVEAPVS